MTKNLKELKESCRQQSEELQDLLIQRDKLKEENVMNGNLDDTLVNDSAQEKPATAAQTNARAAKKRGTKDEGDQEFEDEALQVEDLEPTGVAAAKVSLAFHSVFFFLFWEWAPEQTRKRSLGTGRKCSGQIPIISFYLFINFFVPTRLSAPGSLSDGGVFVVSCLLLSNLRSGVHFTADRLAQW